MHAEHSFVILKLDKVDEPGSMDVLVRTVAAFEQHEFEDREDIEFVGDDEAGRRFNTQVLIQTVRLGQFPRHWPSRWRENCRCSIDGGTAQVVCFATRF